MKIILALGGIILLGVAIGMLAPSEQCPETFQGPKDAPITIDYYQNTECLPCTQQAPILERFMNKHDDVLLRTVTMDACVPDRKVPGVPYYVVKTPEKEVTDHGLKTVPQLETLIWGVA